MLVLIAGLVVFFGAHVFSAVRSRAPGRDIKERMGYGPYMGLYSLVSLIGLGLIIYGYGLSRGAGVLYGPPVWLKHVNLLLMAPALVFLVASQVPTGWIKKTVKHPMLLAVKIWAFGHLLANGELNSVVLFGSFLAYGVLDRIALKKRGDNGPGPDAAVNAMGDVGAVVIGVAAYLAVFLWLHPILFGVVARPG